MNSVCFHKLRKVKYLKLVDLPSGSSREGESYVYFLPTIDIQLLRICYMPGVGNHVICSTAPVLSATMVLQSGACYHLNLTNGEMSLNEVPCPR